MLDVQRDSEVLLHQNPSEDENVWSKQLLEQRGHVRQSLVLEDGHAGCRGSSGASYRRGVGSVVGLIQDGQNLSFGING